MRRLSALAALSLALAAPAAAATYHVDFGHGRDTASGLSPAEAWKRAPGDSRAGPVPRATALQPGDTILFRGGVPYRGTIRVHSAGLAGAPIRYLGRGWGDGSAIMAGGDGRVGFLLLGGGHVELSGFAFTGFAPASGHGPYAGRPLVQLQPLAGLRLDQLLQDGRPLLAPLMAPAPVRAIAGITSGPPPAAP